MATHSPHSDHTSAHLTALLDATDEGIYEMDGQGSCTFVNRAAAEMLGYSPDEVLGRDVHSLIHHTRPDGTPYPQEACPLFRALRGGTGVRLVGEVLWRKDGTSFPAETSCFPLVEEGTPRGAVVTFTDITKRLSLEQQKDALLAMVTHDLRNPLTVIKAQSQLLQRLSQNGEPSSATALVRGIGEIANSAARMTAMLDDLVDLARVAAGHPLSLNLRPTDLVALARTVAQAQQQTAAQHRIQLESVVPEAVGLWDPLRLERALHNLVSNAVKYSLYGGDILIKVGRQDAWAVLQVRDMGLGIAREDLPRVFDLYYRGRTVAGAVPGTGLGLASAKQIVEQHGGTISVESEEGKGSTFTLRLPLSDELRQAALAWAASGTTAGVAPPTAETTAGGVPSQTETRSPLNS